MKCQSCNTNEATVHLTQTMGDDMRRMDLCEECAKKLGVNDPTGFSLADLMKSLESEMRKKDSRGEKD